MATPQQSIELTLRGRAMAALSGLSLLGAWLSGDPSVQLAAALLTAPLLVDFAWKPRVLSQLALRVAARHTVAGASFRERIAIENPTRATLHDLVVFERRTRSSPALVTRCSPGSSAQVALGCRGPERSHLLERVFDLACEWPLGLFRARATAVVASDLVAEPRRVPQKALPGPSAEALRATAQQHPQHAGEEFHALREQYDGEDARGVHARRSAALGQLVRTVTRSRSPSTIGIVLDLRRPPGRSLQNGRTRFEWCLGAAATLAETLRERECRLVAVVLGEATTRVVVHDAVSLRDWLVLLAEAGPTLHRPLESAALAELGDLDDCYWLPAGGYRAPEEHELHGGRVQVVEGGLA